MIKLLTFLLCLFFSYLHSVEFVLFTQPKSGTHLIINLLTQLTGKQVYWAPEYQKKRGDAFFTMQMPPWTQEMMDEVWRKNKEKTTFLHLHMRYSPELEEYLSDKSCVNFFVKRDPRDQIVSLLNHYKHIHVNDKAIEQFASDDEKLLYLIRNSLRKDLLPFMGWLNASNCCVLDFSKLMGVHGGAATHADALSEVRKIASALHLKRSDSDLQRVYQKSFGKGWSFFKGKVGSWKNYFNDEHKQAVKEEIGDLLIELGFEQDLDW